MKDIKSYVEERLTKLNLSQAEILSIQLTGSSLLFKNERKDLDYQIVVSGITIDEEKAIYDTSKLENGLKIDLFIDTIETLEKRMTFNISNNLEDFNRRYYFFNSCFLLSNRDEFILYGEKINNIDSKFFDYESNYHNLITEILNNISDDMYANKQLKWWILTLDLLKNKSQKPSLFALNISKTIHDKKMKMDDFKNIIRDNYIDL
jgi:hypothetical protein